MRRRRNHVQARWVASALLCSLAVGCAVASPIRPAATSKSPFWFPIWGGSVQVISEVPEGEQYRISHRGSTGFTAVSALKRTAQRRAEQWCGEEHAMTPISERRSRGLHILGNFPRYEMIFVCEPKERPELAPGSSSADPYDELRRLKSLLDDGIITEEEFQREKRRILGH